MSAEAVEPVSVDEVAAELGLPGDETPEETQPDGQTVTEEPAAEQEQGEAEQAAEEQTEEEKKFYKLNARERVQQAVAKANEAKQAADAERQARVALENRLQEIEKQTQRQALPFTPPEEIDTDRLNHWFLENNIVVL